MPESEITLDDLADVQIWGLAGMVKHRWRASTLTLEISSELALESDKNVATVDLNLELFGKKGEDGGEEEADEKGILMYTGSISVLVKFDPSFEVPETPESAGQLVSAVWPFMRMPLIEHGQRLGAPPLLLPLSPHLGVADSTE